MLPAWATVVLALGTALAALGGVWLQGILARSERERVESKERRERGGQLIAPLLGLIADASPARVLINAHLAGEMLTDLWTRWNLLRERLIAYAVVHPSRRVDELARVLATGINTSLGDTAYAVRTLDTAETREDIDKAHASHDRVSETAGELLEEIRRG
jgi:hypothetical protein